MSKNVTGATGCSAGAVISLNLIVSKYEAIKRKQAESSNKEKSQSNSTKKVDSAASAGSGNNAGAMSASSGGSSTVNDIEPMSTADNVVEICVVTYISGHEQYAQKEIEKGKNIGELPEEPSVDKAHFRGWWTDKIGVDERKQFTAGTRVKEDVTIYAKWVYIITYRYNDKIIERREVEVEAPGNNYKYVLELEPIAGGYKTGVLHEEE